MTAARVMVPEVKCELDLYEYVLVKTKYVLLVCLLLGTYRYE